MYRSCVHVLGNTIGVQHIKSMSCVKRKSVRILFDRHSECRGNKHFKIRGYFVTSVENVNEEGEYKNGTYICN